MTAPTPAWSRVPAQSVRRPGGDSGVTWRSRCPHGTDAEWTAVRHDTQVHMSVDCDCEEVA